jgi:23S rRNA (adenine2503-C2)-methyltransferase
LKKDIRDCSIEELTDFCVSNGMKKYVSSQIFSWLWKKSSLSIDEMTNLSLSNRSLLKKEFTINGIATDLEEESNDGTIKSRFILHDKNLVEGVLIPQNKRMTACISSQVGCSLSCKFCATGKIGRIRNLSAGEIYDQVISISNQAINKYDIPLSNIVFMGMGEPLLNYKNVIQSINHLTSEEGLNMSPRRITLSTSGISKMIRRLADDEVKVNLALSLHAASEEKRNTIMPIGESNSLSSLRDSLKYYFSKLKKKVTYEYVLLKDINDGLEDAKDLYNFTKHVPSKINLIEYNSVEGLEYQKSSVEKTNIFIEFLEKKGLNVGVRRSRGEDINAACGQLANKK